MTSAGVRLRLSWRVLKAPNGRIGAREHLWHTVELDPDAAVEVEIRVDVKAMACNQSRSSESISGGVSLRLHPLCNEADRDRHENSQQIFFERHDRDVNKGVRFVEWAAVVRSASH